MQLFISYFYPLSLSLSLSLQYKPPSFVSLFTFSPLLGNASSWVYYDDRYGSWRMSTSTIIEDNFGIFGFGFCWRIWIFWTGGGLWIVGSGCGFWVVGLMDAFRVVALWWVGLSLISVLFPLISPDSLFLFSFSFFILFFARPNLTLNGSYFSCPFLSING